ncbi:MAG: hypothetical protein ACJ746_13665 [Bryobacteraceae bacterium]
MEWMGRRGRTANVTTEHGQRIQWLQETYGISDGELCAGAGFTRQTLWVQKTNPKVELNWELQESLVGFLLRRLGRTSADKDLVKRNLFGASVRFDQFCQMYKKRQLPEMVYKYSETVIDGEVIKTVSGGRRSHDSS